MVEHIEKTKRSVDPAGEEVETYKTTRTVRGGYGLGLLENLIWLAYAVVLIILAFRFFLALFGANPANGFADFIYDISGPIVSPFFGLFNYHVNYTYGHFEIYTIVAAIVYGVAAWILTEVINLGRR